MASAAFDHLVVAAATLEQGEAYLEQRLGVRPQRGGKHALMGTHNSLIGLGAKRYIEVIAIDPEASPPLGQRWFALDTPALQSTLPRLIHWVARTARHRHRATVPWRRPRRSPGDDAGWLRMADHRAG